jgi:hypothetical protein
LNHQLAPALPPSCPFIRAGGGGVLGPSLTMKFTKSKPVANLPIRPVGFVTLDELELWLTCRLRWRFYENRPPDSELTPWEHLRHCVHECVLFYHRERAEGRKAAYPIVQEHYWDTFERQSLEASQNNYAPGERARDMRAGEDVLERYVEEAQKKSCGLLGQSVVLSAKIPGAKWPLKVTVDLLKSDLVPVALRVVRTLPDTELASFHLAPWSAAVISGCQARFGRKPTRLEAVFLVASESPQVVRLPLPTPPPETLTKLRLWMRAFTCGLAHSEVYPQPGEHCVTCSFREPCAHWPNLTSK